jgi:uncharacterized peroxidase-related enzyme
MEPMNLPAVENNNEARGGYKELIDTVRKAGGSVSQIWHLFAFKPEATKHLETFSQAVMRGPSPLSPALRELIAAYTSAGNECRFCRTSHTAVAEELYTDSTLVLGALEDVQSSRLSPAEKALLTFVAKVNHDAQRITPADVKPLHDAGWSDEAIYDAITVCALFNFFNRWVGATGVHQQPDEAIRATGKRLAERGYIRS